MTDGVKGAIADIAETVVKPIVDEVGKAIEEGVTSVIKGPGQSMSSQGAGFSSSLSDVTDAEKLAKARSDIAWYQKIEEAQQKVRAEDDQREQDRLQSQQQEEQQSKQEDLMKVQSSKQQMVQEAKQRAMVELKAGKGVGG